MVFRAVLCVLSCAGIVSAGLIGMECAQWATEKQDWEDMTGALTKTVQCNVTYVRSNGLEKEPTSEDCDGEPCPDKYRSWISVVYLANHDDQRYTQARCYSHISDGYEKSKEVPERFLERYQPNTTQSCCIEPSPPFDSAMFCDWDEREPEFQPTVLAVCSALLGVALLYAATYFLCKRYDGPCCHEDHVAPQEYEMGDNWSQPSAD